MKFGLLYETQRPYQGTDIDWNALYKETLEQCELADQVGFDNLWFVEHHFLTGFSGSPCPEVLFGALSQITKQIRIGFGVCILPYHHPVRVAERVAMVDQLTDGRVEFGTGRSNVYEQTGLGIDPGNPRAVGRVHQHAAQNLAVRRVLLRGQVLERAQPPGVAQALPETPSPHVLGLHPNRSFRFAAEKGIGVLSSASYATSILADHVKTYRENIKNAEPVGAFINNFWGNNVHAFCGTDNQEARELCAQSMKTFFGPDKPYIAGRVGAYEELLEAWGGVPDHLQADFGRWLRQSDDAHKQQAEEAGLSLDLPVPARRGPP